MPVVVTCRCGQSFRAIDELAGKLVNCPSCGQPLAIPAHDVKSLKSASAAQDLGGLSGLEQSAMPAADPPGFAASDRFATARSAFPSSQLPTEGGLDRRAIIAIWIGGSVVVLMVLAMVLTSLFSGPDEGLGNQLAGDVQPGETESTEPAVDKVEIPTPSADASRHRGIPSNESETADVVVEIEPADAEPAAVRSDGDDNEHYEEGGEHAEDDDGRSSGWASATRHSSQPGGISIRLSAGTALAQTLPTGTAMGFSVDYEFDSGQSDSAAVYFWVIKPSGLQPLRQPVRLQSEGTLQTFVPNLRPDDGPFETHIENQRGTNLSTPLKLR